MSGQVQANEVEVPVTTNVNLEALTVSATRMSKPISSIPQIVTTIDSDDIKQSQMLNDTLGGVLEQHVADFSPPSSNMTDRAVSIRGRNPLYLIDGVPQHNALRDGQRDGHTIDMDFVDRIEVVHGANAIQGTGAIGGVIKLVTKQTKPGEPFSGSIKTKLESDDGFKGDGLHKKVSGIFREGLEMRL